jgi:acid stress-induced BolA-like protein IbaG/YrbA
MGQQISQILAGAFPGIQANIEDMPGGRISGTVIWNGFAGHDFVERQQMIRKVLEAGLALLQQRLGFQNAVYIGDTLDDLRTVKNFNERHAAGGATFLSAQVLTGPAGKANEKLFRNAGADLIAPDVNAVLDWLAGG